MNPLLARKYVNLLDRSFLARSVVRRAFLTPDRKRPTVPVSAAAQANLADLRRDGIVGLRAYLPDVADYVERAYFQATARGETASGPMMIDTLDQRSKMTGRGVQLAISFKDRDLAPLFFDPDICGILYNYYGRQAYYRNQPLVMSTAYDGRAEVQTDYRYAQMKYHLDLGLRQVSLMLLVNDIGPNDTHMQFAVGSHAVYPRSVDRHAYADEDIERRFPTIDAIGPKGTLFIFDAGNGYHRVRLREGTVRKIVHLNVTSGYYPAPAKRYDSLSGWDALTGFSPHVRHMMDRLLA